MDKRLTYNLIVIFLCLILFFMYYPSEVSRFFLIVVMIGIFFSLEKVIPDSNKKLKYTVISILFVLGFCITIFNFL